MDRIHEEIERVLPDGGLVVEVTHMVSFIQDQKTGSLQGFKLLMLGGCSWRPNHEFLTVPLTLRESGIGHLRERLNVDTRGIEKSVQFTFSEEGQARAVLRWLADLENVDLNPKTDLRPAVKKELTRRRVSHLPNIFEGQHDEWDEVSFEYLGVSVRQSKTIVKRFLRKGKEIPLVKLSHGWTMHLPQEMFFRLTAGPHFQVKISPGCNFTLPSKYRSEDLRRKLLSIYL